MHELQVTPLLANKVPKPRRSRYKLKRASQSFDDYMESDHNYNRDKRRSFHRQRSNPNILDIIPPPPPLYAPPSLPSEPPPPPYSRSANSRSSRIAAFKLRSSSHIIDSESEYFAQVCYSLFARFSVAIKQGKVFSPFAHILHMAGLQTNSLFLQFIIIYITFSVHLLTRLTGGTKYHKKAFKQSLSL